MRNKINGDYCKYKEHRREIETHLKELERKRELLKVSQYEPLYKVYYNLEEYE